MAGFEGLREIGQIALNVGDVEEATAYYRDGLGMRHLFMAPPKMSFFDCGGIRLMLGEPERGEGAGERAGERAGEGAGEGVAPGSIVYYRVADIKEAHGVLRERGVEFEEEPRKVAELEGTELWLAFFRDPWENVLALMSEVAAE